MELNEWLCNLVNVMVIMSYQQAFLEGKGCLVNLVSFSWASRPGDFSILQVWPVILKVG